MAWRTDRICRDLADGDAPASGETGPRHPSALPTCMHGLPSLLGQARLSDSARPEPSVRRAACCQRLEAKTDRYNGGVGSVAEWSIAPVLKTGGPKGSVSSNLTASATQSSSAIGAFFMAGPFAPAALLVLTALG